jgi:hypothetical protein
MPVSVSMMSFMVVDILLLCTNETA